MTDSMKNALLTVLAAVGVLIAIWITQLKSELPGPTPIPSPVVSPTESPSPVISVSPSPSPSPSPSVSKTPSPSPTLSPSPSPSPSKSPSPSPSPSKSPSPSPSPVAIGVPYGPYSGFASYTSISPNQEMFNYGQSSDSANKSCVTCKPAIIQKIDWARANHWHLGLTMTGGAHDNYMSTINGVLQFDYAKWKAKQDTFNTAEIQAAISAGVADGTIVGTNIMDEPHVCADPNSGGNTWGPCGTMTKAIVDGMCKYVKDMFPTLQVGVAHQHKVFQPTIGYQNCDFIISQFSYRDGTPAAYRDAAIAWGKNIGHVQIMFSFNSVNGGTQDTDGTWDCAAQGGIKGQRDKQCAMTPLQIFETSTTLGKATCGAQTHWRYYDTLMSRPEIKQAHTDAANILKASPLACKLTRR